jgi:HEAT repeat protein
MRSIVRSLAAIAIVSAVTAFAQQPQFLHANLTTTTAAHGLNAELDTLKSEAAPLWVGYSIPVAEKESSGWNPRIVYLEGDHPNVKDDAVDSSQHSYDHAVILFRIADHNIVKIHVDHPDRQIDAGDLRVVWLTNVTSDDSIATLKSLALQNDTRRLRDAAVFAISIHQSPVTVPALISLAAPANDLDLREKAAFWLANQHGAESFAALKRFAREDPDAGFREKLAFDLTLTKNPDAINELIRMAHEDSSPQVRRQAQFWMATKGGKVVAGDLRNLAENDPDTQLRKSAVFALSRLPGDEAATQLIHIASTSKDPAVRKQAVFWLGQSSDPRALDYLTKLLKQ